MGQIVSRSLNEPQRKGLSWDELWRGPDKGLIACWEIGIEMSQKKPDLAKSAKGGELPVLPWKGGVEKKLENEKYGSLNYLAQWQGLRGEDLYIDLSEEIEIECKRTGVKVVFTADINKF